MKNLEKGAGINSRYLLNPSRVFARFLQRKFLHRRNVTKVERHLHNEKQRDQGRTAILKSPRSKATKYEQASSNQETEI
jgi:hypothetical protein